MTLKVMQKPDLDELQGKFENVNRSIGADVTHAFEDFADGLEGRWKAGGKKP